MPAVVANRLGETFLPGDENNGDEAILSLNYQRDACVSTDCFTSFRNDGTVRNCRAVVANRHAETFLPGDKNNGDEAIWSLNYQHDAYLSTDCFTSFRNDGNCSQLSGKYSQ